MGAYLNGQRVLVAYGGQNLISTAYTNVIQNCICTVLSPNSLYIEQTAVGMQAAASIFKHFTKGEYTISYSYALEADAANTNPFILYRVSTSDGAITGSSSWKDLISHSSPHVSTAEGKWTDVSSSFTIDEDGWYAFVWRLQSGTSASATTCRKVTIKNLMLNRGTTEAPFREFLSINGWDNLISTDMLGVRDLCIFEALSSSSMRITQRNPGVSGSAYLYRYLAKGTYTISYLFTLDADPGNTCGIGFYVGHSNTTGGLNTAAGGWVSYHYHDKVVTNENINKMRYSFTFTVPENGYYCLSWYIQLGTATSPTKCRVITIENLMLNRGNKAMSFREFAPLGSYRNLFDLSKLTFNGGGATKVGKSIVHVNDTANATYASSFDASCISLKPNTTYTSRCFLTIEASQAVVQTAGAMHGKIMLQTVNTWTDNNNRLSIAGYPTTTYAPDTLERTEIYLTFTTPSNVSDYKYLVFRTSSYTTSTFENIEIVEGEHTKKTFDVALSNGLCRLKTFGKNLIDMSANWHVSGATATLSKHSLYAKQINWSFVGTLHMDKYLAKGTYTISYLFTPVIYEKKPSFKIGYKIAENTLRTIFSRDLATSNVKDEFYSFTFDAENDGVYRFEWTIPTALTNDESKLGAITLSNIMLNHGDKALPFRPYTNHDD